MSGCRFFGVLAIFVVACRMSVEVAKNVYYRTHQLTSDRPLQRAHAHRVRRIAAPWSNYGRLPVCPEPAIHLQRLGTWQAAPMGMDSGGWR